MSSLNVIRAVLHTRDISPFLDHTQVLEEVLRWLLVFQSNYRKRIYLEGAIPDNIRSEV